MSIKDKYRVIPIDKFLTKEWCLRKHYAKRIPSVIIYSFGLYDNENTLQGVNTFGLAGNYNLNTIGNFETLELTRLIINENLEKNVLSFFVSQSLLQIEKGKIIISYADPNNGHNGFIYQATNWIYTGIGNDTIVLEKDNIEYHQKSIYDIFENGKRVFTHNNCLPCKNMTTKQMQKVELYYPTYFDKANKLSCEIGKHWGREADTSINYCKVCED